MFLWEGLQESYLYASWPDHAATTSSLEAGEVKAFKCLTSRKGIVSLVNTYEVNRNSKKGIISLVNAGEIIQTLKKGAIPLVTHKGG